MVSPGRIFSALIVIVVGLALLPVVRDFVAIGANGASSAEAIILGLIPLFWVLGLLIASAVLLGVGNMGSKR